MRRVALAATIFLALAAPAWAGTDGIGVWQPGLMASPSGGLDNAKRAEAVCLSEIIKAETKYGIPKNLMLAMGFTEAGRATPDGPMTVWPWTINVEGQGYWFPTKEIAIDAVKQFLAQGKRSIDVGCMQVNLKWHPTAFKTLDEAFDPVANVDYAGRFLQELHVLHANDWDRAVGFYHSPAEAEQTLYRNKVRSNATFTGAARGYLQQVADAPPNTPMARFSWGMIGSQGSGWGSLFANGTPQPILPKLLAGR
jgi:hypothetical protein